ncbi:UDP-xylose transporter 1-like isoform X1 [Carex rostrata]
MAHMITPRLHQTGKHRESKSSEVEKMLSDGSQIGVIGSLALSVTSSVAIVICNKYLISSLGFLFATTLTSWHLLVTFLTLHVAQRLRFFEPKQIDAQTNILFGLLNGTCIGLLNLCLGFNSVGFYQMTKLAIIPFTVLLETIFLNKRFSQSVKMSLMVLLLGVGIASVTDLQLNFLGSVIAALALITTCISQILTNTIQKRLKVSSTQLLYQSSPYQAAILFISGPFVDKMLTRRSVFAFNYTVQVLIFITLSCLIAVSVNFSTFLVIGTTSPVTYQVLGHLKTCLILSFGYVVLMEPFTVRNILGILIAIFGMGLYSYFSVQESRNKKLESKDSINSNDDSLPISQTTDKEGAPLLSSKLLGLDEENGNLLEDTNLSKNAKNVF